MTDDRHADERTVPTWPVADDAPATVPAGPVDDVASPFVTLAALGSVLVLVTLAVLQFAPAGSRLPLLVAIALAAAATVVVAGLDVDLAWVDHNGPGVRLTLVPIVVVAAVLALSVAGAALLGPNRAVDDDDLVLTRPSGTSALVVSGELSDAADLVLAADGRSRTVAVGPGSFSVDTADALGELAGCIPVAFVLEGTTINGTARTAGCP